MCTMSAYGDIGGLDQQVQEIKLGTLVTGMTLYSLIICVHMYMYMYNVCMYTLAGMNVQPTLLSHIQHT